MEDMEYYEFFGSTSIESKQKDVSERLKKALSREYLNTNSLIKLKYDISDYLKIEGITHPIKINFKGFNDIEEIFSNDIVNLTLYDSIKYTFKRELSRNNIYNGTWLVKDDEDNIYLSKRPFSLNCLRDTNFHNTEYGQFYGMLKREIKIKVLEEYIENVKHKIEKVFEGSPYQIIGVRFSIKGSNYDR